MKVQLKYTMALCFVGLLSASCKREFLDPIPQTSITDATSFDTPDRIANQVRSLYAALKNGNFYGGRFLVYGDIRADDFLNETSNNVTGYDVYNLNPTNTSQNSVKNLWSEIFPPSTQIAKDPLMVVCAARIEGIKNQLNLIKALNNTKFKLYLIGNPAPNQQAYYHECKKQAGANIFFIDNLSQQKLAEYYSRAKVHVLPSWFETTGLSSLEAAALGCNIVAGNRGDAKEYFNDHAFYCDPARPQSIVEAVEQAADNPVDPALEQQIRTKFTWHQAALSTIQAYKAII